MKRWMKKFTAVVATAAMVCSMGMPAFAAEDNVLNQDKINEYTHVPVFGIVEADGIEVWSKIETNVETEMLSVEDKLELGRDTLESVMDYQDKGGAINWDEDGVETVVKDLYPDLYPEIKERLNPNEKFLIPLNKDTVATRGSQGHRHSYTHLGILGEKLYGVTTTFNWSWNDSTKDLIGIYPSSSAESYDFAWDPVGNGINSSNGYFINGKQRYQHTTEGIFKSSIGTYAYPYMEVELWAGGSAMVGGGKR